MHFLDRELPGVFDKLAKLSDRRRREVVERACVVVSQQVAELSAEARELLRKLGQPGGLTDADIATANAMAEAADDKYFGLHERDLEAAGRTFSEARLLFAIAMGCGARSAAESADAVYELSKVLDDSTVVPRVMEAEMGRKSVD